MAAKRSATTELNHDNWNYEEVPEEAGTFAKASEEILQKRVIKPARRRLPNSGGGTPQSAFDTFAGFKTSATTPSPFSFLAGTNSTTKDTPTNTSAIESTSTAINNGSPKIPKNGLDATAWSGTKNQTLQTMEVEAEKNADKKEDKLSQQSSGYYAKLKGLNESVTQWIKTHVDSNPFCILTPIFRDYEKHLKDIESSHSCHEKTAVTNSKEKSNQPTVTESTITKDPPVTVEKKSENSVLTNKTTNASPLSGSDWKPEKSIFGNTNIGKSIFENPEKNPFLNKSTVAEEKKEDTIEKVETKPPVTSSSSFPQGASIFSFGFGSTTNTASAGFSFGSTKPFSFGAQAVKPQESENKTEDDEKNEDEEPPKPEFKPVTEEGAVFQQRCKVFVKKEKNFSDRGVGTLYLKPTPNGKTQLIVRADTSLGNLLLNTLLTESIPIQRMNKNTVMMVCIPTSDSQPPPTPVLLRVKTSEEADTLLETLGKYKK